MWFVLFIIDMVYKNVYVINFDSGVELEGFDFLLKLDMVW